MSKPLTLDRATGKVYYGNTPEEAYLAALRDTDAGVKHDTDKLRVELLPVDVLKGVAGILSHGAKKYGDRNWERGISYSRLYGATLRHLFAVWEGEDNDAESGLPHIDHALCELMFLSAMMKRRKDLDDRPKEAKG